jgi:hypothetical protein
MMSVKSRLEKLATKVERAGVPWGLAIYRTTYTPFSDTHFADVIELITALAKYSMREFEDASPNDSRNETAKSFLQESYKPIIMNNKFEFDGMSLDQIRAHYQALVERPVGERSITNEWFCVLVDEEVMQTLAGADPATLITTQNISDDYNKYWLKAVESDPEDEDDKGWMKCSVYVVWNLWVDMDGHTPMSSYEALYPRGAYCG